MHIASSSPSSTESPTIINGMEDFMNRVIAESGLALPDFKEEPAKVEVDEENPTTKQSPNPVTRVGKAFQKSLNHIRNLPMGSQAKAFHKLLKPSLRKAHVKGLTNIASAMKLFERLSWEVTPHLMEPDDKGEIVLMEAVLPKGVIANCAYSSVAEIHRHHGEPGLKSIQLSRGERDFYLLTPIQVRTDKISAHLRVDKKGNEYLSAWFPGKEVQSYLKLGMGTEIVKCSQFDLPAFD